MSKAKRTRKARAAAPADKPANLGAILEALDLGIERLENDFYETGAEAWQDYGVQYAHERLLWAYRELEKRAAKKKDGRK